MGYEPYRVDPGAHAHVPSSRMAGAGYRREASCARIIWSPFARPLAGYEADISDVGKLLEALGSRRCRWMRCWVYCVSERLLDLEFGRLVREAARDDGLEIVVDPRQNIARAFKDGLDGVNHRVFVTHGARDKFHPKVMLFAIERPDGREDRIALVGSGNLSAGGLYRNDELFVLHCEVAERPTRSRVGDVWWREARGLSQWPELVKVTKEFADSAVDIDWSKMPEVTSPDLEDGPRVLGTLARVPDAPESGAEPMIAPSHPEPESPRMDPPPNDDDAIDYVLSGLSKDELSRACGRLDLRRSGNLGELASRLRKHFAGSAQGLLESLNGDELETLLRFRFDDGENEFELRTNEARVGDLRRAAIRMYVDAWGPSHDGAVIVSPITAKIIGRVPEDVDIDEDHLPAIEQIDPSRAQPKPLADFQEAAVHALNVHFLKQRNDVGLLCLPTGGGKTRTALHFLLGDYIARGQRVIWLAHRAELLNQVHRELRDFHLPSLRPFSVSRFDGTRKRLDGDFVLVSTSSLVRSGITQRQLMAANGNAIGILCFDEAHRAAARGTRKKLRTLRASCSDAPLLALTATPFRAGEGETERLHELIGSRPVFERTFAELIRCGFLARPIPVALPLSATRSFEITDDEQRDTKRRGDLSPSVLSRLAKHKTRNEEIVDHWCAHRYVYAQTIVFACNIEHAETLHDMFSRRGVHTHMVHSQKEPAEVRATIARFRHQHEPGVLINVGILTEGVDVPNARTVLLARPTLSEVLYRQMIGRAARGPKACEGKTTFRIIDCVDHFTRFGIHVGLALAGEKVRAELSLEATDLERLDPAQPQPPLAGSSPRQLAHAVHEALAMVVARGLATSSYSFWGTLTWMTPTGQRDAIAVFQENLALVEAAVLAVTDCVEGRSSRWASIRELGQYLETEGVFLRERDWQRMVDDVAATKQPAHMTPVPELEALVDQHELAARAAALRGSDDLSPENTFSDTDRAAIVAGETLQRVVDLGMYVAAADGAVVSQELVALKDAVQRLAESDDPVLIEEIDQAMARSAGLRQPVGDLARALRVALSLRQRLATLDMAFAIAKADGRIAHEELVLAKRIADMLELPERMAEERFDALGDEVPTVRELRQSKYVTCSECDKTWPAGPKFCGDCGATLPLDALV